MDWKALGDWLWDAACSLRGSEADAPKFKDYILPLVFLKRLSDVFDDEIAHLGAEFGGAEAALQMVEAEHQALKDESGKGIVRFYLPPEARWPAIARRATGVGEYLTDVVRSVARENKLLHDVLDIIDFNATAAGKRIVSDDALLKLVQKLGKHRLGLVDVEPDILGRAYEYLLQKFAEGQGKSAGEFYTPWSVATMMAMVIAPEPDMTLYDPCCGSAGLLIKCHLEFLERHGAQKNGRKVLPGSVAPLGYFGQENVATTFALARMNSIVHDMEANIEHSDTMNAPQFKNADGSLRQFNLVLANPMWNQKTFDDTTYENDQYNRFQAGYPPASSADWGWVQHMWASLTPKGRMAVVLDTGAVSRGSGNRGANRERDIRRAFIEGDPQKNIAGDWIEAVVLLPENLFFNTSAPGIVMVLNQSKRHPGEILLINASKLCAKGRPKNYMEPEHMRRVAEAYHNWQDVEQLCKVITTAEAAKNDYNLSPSRYVAVDDAAEVLPLEESVLELRQAQEERRSAEAALDEVLQALGLGNSHD